jgi:magnesium transporter
VPVAAPDDTVADVFAALRGQRFDSAAVVAVVEDGALRGVLTIERLLAATATSRVADVMDADPPTVAPHTDQEHAAWQAIQHGEPGLAVVDDAGRFRGLVPPQQLLGVLLKEHDEDLARVGGFLAESAEARTASTAPVVRRMVQRLPWLAVGFAGALLSALIVGAFEDELRQEVVIALFMPGVVYLADAVGVQTTTLVVRGLSVGVGVGAVALRELVTGLAVGLILAAAALPVVLLWGSAPVAWAVAVALLAASSFATVIAMALPALLHRLGLDPAYGAGPLATVVQDLLSLFVYFVAATLIVF